MAKITKAQEQVVGTGGQLDLNAAAAPGRSMVDAGGQVAAVGKKFFQEAKGAIDLAAYSNAMGSATQEFTAKAQERLKQTVDKDGNPNFEALPKDIERIGQDILGKRSGLMASPGARAQFRANFGNFLSSQTIKATGVAAKQALEYARHSVFTNLDSLKESTLANPDLAVDNTAQAQQILEDAAKAGSITRTEAEEQEEKYRAATIPELIKQQIIADPQGMKAVLEEAKPEDMRLKYAEHERLKQIADAAIRDQQKQEEAIQAEEQRRVRTAVDIRISEYETQMAQDQLTGKKTVTESLILSDETLSMDPAKKNRMLEKLYKSEAKESKRVQAVNAIQDTVSRGETLSGFKPSQLDDWYTSSVRSVAEQTGQKVPFNVAIGIAAQAGATDIPVFKKQAEEMLVSGNPEEAAQAIQALKQAESYSPETVNNLSAKTKAIYELASRKMYEGNSDPTTALELARNEVLKVDDARTEELKASFNKESDFKPTNIPDLIDDAFDEFTTGFGSADQAAGVAAAYRNKLQESYIASNGDIDAAIATANRELKSIMGETTFNDGNHIMLHSPDKIFSAYDKDVLHESLSEYLDFTYEGEVDPNDVVIRSDRYTRGLMINGEEAINYGLFTRDGQPIIDKETGRPDRWVVTESNLQSIKSAKDMDELSREVRFRENVENFKPNLGMRGADRFMASGVNVSDFERGVRKMSISEKGPYSQVLANAGPTLEKYGINTNRRLRHFLAQIGHESASFSATVERPSNKSGMNFEKYDPGTNVGRILGNTQPGDGARFKGRGLIQLTGRWNYEHMGKKIGVDLVNNPDLAADPKIALEIAAAFWQDKKLNEKADNNDLRGITKKLNGGYNGFNDRKRRFEQLDFLGE